MQRLLGLLTASLAVAASLQAAPESAALRVGFAEHDITPAITPDQPVWIAGYGHGRRATGVHDPILVRGVVLDDGRQRIALLSLDLVGLQYAEVERIRRELPEYDYVLASSTHNHEGPDVVGIWGATPVQRGVSESYLQQVVAGAVQAVRAAEKQLVPARAAFGTVQDESLVEDSREPYVKDAVIRVLRFESPRDGRVLGLVTQFSCHPESLGSRNTLLTADFPAATVARLKREFDCPVVYMSGAVGGLMSNPGAPRRDAQGREVREGTFEFATVYGEAVADRMSEAARAAQPIRLTPFHVSAQPVTIPVENVYYRAARELGVLQRNLTPTPDDSKPVQPAATEPGKKPATAKETTSPGSAGTSDQTTPAAGALATASEVACLRLGELLIAAIPGEIYPELVYGRVQDPVDPGADFPTAAVEPSIQELMPHDRWMIFGLANDEIGYIIPKRQWDAEPPFCYGRSKSQYGEINSCGPEVAPRIMAAFQRAVERVTAK